MKHTYLFFGAAVCLILGSSCKTTPTPAAIVPQSAAATTSTSAPATGAAAVSQPEPAHSTRGLQFRRGKALLESGNHLEAIKTFAYLRDHAESPEERDRAVIGLSMALQDSGKSGAALGTLEPLPRLPQSSTEAMKCLLAGELFLHQKNYENARVWLIRGLEFEPHSTKRHRASGLFNLGKAFLAEDDMESAQTAFFEAGEIFLSRGDEVNANQCQVILADLRRSLL